jgi:hypothetical protein
LMRKGFAVGSGDPVIFFSFRQRPLADKAILRLCPF